ncbi:MAG: GIY-YIG nuclease family protein [Bifidobacteriaceae bacterium]|nr:GIY-YIG nuclease family protein [Bifidobacteriaceae bacterium]
MTAEIMNWTGHIMAAPRTKLGELLRRDEASRTGVYILLGEDPDSTGQETGYIGEGDVVATRLRAHNQSQDKKGKDFWTRVIVLTSKDANLTKAHARYLESRFIALANEAKRITLVNGTAPDPVPLPEADRSDMEYFIGQAQIVLPVLGVNLLRTRPGSSDGEGGAGPARRSVSPVFEMQIPGGGTATAQEFDGEFTILAGSEARGEWSSGKLKHATHTRRDQWESLQASGALTRGTDGRLRFQYDQVFSSPSAAAAVVAGTATRNGRLEWKDQATGASYAQWQEQVINDAIL